MGTYWKYCSNYVEGGRTPNISFLPQDNSLYSWRHTYFGLPIVVNIFYCELCQVFGSHQVFEEIIILQWFLDVALNVGDRYIGPKLVLHIIF